MVEEMEIKVSFLSMIVKSHTDSLIYVLPCPRDKKRILAKINLYLSSLLSLSGT